MIRVNLIEVQRGDALQIPSSEHYLTEENDIDTLISQRNSLRSKPPEISSDQIAETKTQSGEEQRIFP
jgi:hypothetical protein